MTRGKSLLIAFLMLSVGVGGAIVAFVQPDRLPLKDWLTFASAAYDRAGEVFLGISYSMLNLEVKPPIDAGRVLNRKELLYCISENKRLDMIQERLLFFPVAKELDDAIGDYNNRCGHFLYIVYDRISSEKMLATKPDCIRSQAAARVAIWRSKNGSMADSAYGYGALMSGLRRLDLKDRFDTEIVQRRLSELGNYSGTIDGLWGTSSESALVAFKVQNGMGDSPTWDTATQRRLFRPSNYKG